LARPDGSVDVVLSRVRRITATPPFDFAAAGVAIAHVRADMSVESITPVSTAAVTGTDTNGAPELRTYGNSVTSDGQYAYLYAFVTGYPFRLDQYVARVPMNAPLTGPWQYSSCKVEPTFGQQCPAGQRDWSNDPNAARPMDVGGDPSVGVNGPPIAAFHVVSYGGQYLAVAKAVDLPSSNAADHKVLAWRSTTPMGPWVPVGVLGTATPATASGAFTYVAQVLATPSARWVLTWNSNADSAAVNADVRLYGPRFATPANLP
jgi:hypothetical protein